MWFGEDVVEDLGLGSHCNPWVSKSLFLFLLIPSPSLQPDSLTSLASRCYLSLCPAYLFLKVVSGFPGADNTPTYRGIAALSENSFVLGESQVPLCNSGTSGVRSSCSPGLPVFSGHQCLKCKSWRGPAILDPLLKKTWRGPFNSRLVRDNRTDALSVELLDSQTSQLKLYVLLDPPSFKGEAQTSDSIWGPLLESLPPLLSLSASLLVSSLLVFHCWLCCHQALYLWPWPMPLVLHTWHR